VRDTTPHGITHKAVSMTQRGAASRRCGRGPARARLANHRDVAPLVHGLPRVATHRCRSEIDRRERIAVQLVNGHAGNIRVRVTIEQPLNAEVRT